MTDRYTLIAFTSYWGSKFGGINAFNADFLEAMGAAYEGKVDIICVVLEAKAFDIEDARKKNVTLISLPYKPENPYLGRAQAQSAIEEITKNGITFDPNKTIWLGHDRISGEAALEATKEAGGRSALIHHMSYDHYEAFAENSQSANDKRSYQKSLFNKADILMAVGPLLQDALEDMTGRVINMIIPGLAYIDPWHKAPNTFSMFVSGRLSNDALKVKQGQLAVAAFAQSYSQAKKHEQPESLLKRPKLLLRGVDFESEGSQDLHFTSSEDNLKKFAAEYAEGAVINLQALPYTTDRKDLFAELKASSVAAMPSWHEGFGLVAWEAIAAGIPLVLSKDSGVYELIKKNYPGLEDGLVWAVDINGQIDPPYFSPSDLETVSSAILKIAKNPKTAREKAIRLRETLAIYTWAACAEQVVSFFDWDIQKGVINESQIENINTSSNTSKLPVPDNNYYVNNCGLFMPKSSWDINQGMAVSVLLRASEAMVPFDDYRKPELDKLKTWAMETNYPTSIRLLKGEGGAGKTRLAIELCLELKELKWHVGFLQKDLKLDELSKILAALKVDGEPNLIVIDYAETRTNELLALIKLVLNNSEKEKVCILLLARDGGEWWDNLPGKDSATEALLSGYATTGPYTLSPLYKTLEQRQQGFKNAVKAFTQALCIEASELIPDLTGEHFVKPLFIQMSALLSLHGERPKSADGIIRAILNHEQRYWQAALKNTGLDILELTARKLLALVTLTGSFATAREAGSYWKSVDDLDMAPASFSCLFNCLAPLYPGYQGLQAVKPDLLGEALVADMLLKPTGPALLSAALSKSSTNTIRLNALTLMARLSLYKPALNPIIETVFSECLSVLASEIVTVSRETQSNLPELTIVAIGKLKSDVKNSVVAQLSQLIKHDSVALNILNCEVRKLVYEKVKSKAERKTNIIKVQASYSEALYDYSVALYYVGRLKESCSKAKQAVEISSHLVKHDIKKYESAYASTLSNYASRLSDIGKTMEAIEFGKRSLDIHERLAQKDPVRHESNYAMTLNNYANRLRDTGQNELAVEVAKKSLDIHELLAQKDPDLHEPNYAMLLSNYAGHLGDIGQNEQAIKFTKKSLDIRERQAQKNPDRFESDYATSLDNYASHLCDNRQDELAIKFAKKSLDIRERLVQKNPDRFESYYAVSLNNYATHLKNNCQDKQAIKVSKKSLDIRERLAQQNPDRYDVDYAESLSNYAAHLSDIGQYEEVIDKQIKAINILDCYYQKLPRKYAFNLGILILKHQFIIWLADKKQMEGDSLTDADFQQHLMHHESTILELTQVFINGVLATNSDEKKSSFNRVLQAYPGLTIYERKELEENWHCAAAWLYYNDIKSEQIKLWLAEWQAFKKRRGGNVPKWMLDFAEKLEIQWP